MAETGAGGDNGVQSLGEQGGSLQGRDKASQGGRNVGRPKRQSHVQFQWIPSPGGSHSSGVSTAQVDLAPQVGPHGRPRQSPVGHPLGVGVTDTPFNS